MPASWRLLYKDGHTWKPVERASGYGTTLDQFNRTTFHVVETPGLRIEVQLQAGFSGGILQWKVGQVRAGVLAQEPWTVDTPEAPAPSDSR